MNHMPNPRSIAPVSPRRKAPDKVLNAKTVERWKPDPNKRLEILDVLSPRLQLYLVVQPSGAKSWACRYRSGGQPKKLTLGSYPALDLETARKRAGIAQKAVQDGRDPAKEKFEGRSPGSPTAFPAIVQDYIERYQRKHNRSWVETARLLGLWVDRDTGELYAYDGGLCDRWASRGIKTISKTDVLAELKAAIKRGAPTTANRLLAALRRFFSWCAEHDMVTESPCVGVRPPTPESSRDRVLTDQELGWLWVAAGEQGMFEGFVKLLILTACRREEAAGLTEGEINMHGAEWLIPAARAKNGEACAIPLSNIALEIVAKQPRVAGDAGYLFSGTGETSMSGFSRLKRRLDAAMLKQAKKALGANASIPRWTLHDIRRTAASGLAAPPISAPPHVIEALLNHKSGTIRGVAKIYNRYRYGPEKRAALDAWAEHMKTTVLPK